MQFFFTCLGLRPKTSTFLKARLASVLMTQNNTTRNAWTVYPFRLFPNKLGSCDVLRISSILLLLSAMKLQVALCLLLFAFACFACLRNLCRIDSTSIEMTRRSAADVQSVFHTMSYVSPRVWRSSPSLPPCCKQLDVVTAGFGPRISHHFLLHSSLKFSLSVHVISLLPACLPVECGSRRLHDHLLFPCCRMYVMHGRPSKNLLSTSPNCFCFPPVMVSK